MSDKLALYQADWMRVLADVGLGAAAISRAIELAELNGLFDPVKAAIFEDLIHTPIEQPSMSRSEIGIKQHVARRKSHGDLAPCDYCGGTLVMRPNEPRQCYHCKLKPIEEKEV